MKLFYESLSEKDRRRYAAVEAEKLGHGGREYLAQLFGCDPKTIERGRQDLVALPMDSNEGRINAKIGPITRRLLAGHDSLVRSIHSRGRSGGFA